jgi:hypothetical protein
MRIQDERNGETIKEQPAFAHTFRHVYQFILQATDGDTGAASAMFQDISQESYQRNCSLYRVAGCGRTKGATKLDGAQVGLEGVVSKRPGSRHLYGRTREWLKMKNPGSTSGGSARPKGAGGERGRLVRMVRPEWPYAAACKQILSDESDGRSEEGQIADEV